MSFCGRPIVLVTRGKARLAKGSTVYIDGLIYYVTHAEEATELDDVIAHTEVVVAPGGIPSTNTIKASLWNPD